MKRFPGTNELGLSVRWTYRTAFPVLTTEPLPNEVLLDIGSGLRPGVIDHHGAGAAEAAASAKLLLSHPEKVYNHLLGAVHARLAAGKPLPTEPLQLTIVVPTSRSWGDLNTAGQASQVPSASLDVVVGTIFVKSLVETGEFPVWAMLLADYVGIVDQGAERYGHFGQSSDPPRPSAGSVSDQPGFACDPWRLSALVALAQNDGTADADLTGRMVRLMALVESLMERTARLAAQNRSPLRAVDDLYVCWRTLLPQLSPDEPALGALVARIGENLDAYNADLAAIGEAGRLGEIAVPFLAHDGAVFALPVQGLHVTRQPTSLFFKQLARAQGFSLLVWPYAQGTALTKEGDIPIKRYVISLDESVRRTLHSDDGVDAHQGSVPGTATAAPLVVRPTLMGLGQRLEAMEVAARQRLTRSDNSLVRGGRPRWPGATNEDPWYDGRGHQFTIVDTPKAGSLLAVVEVLQVLEEPYWETRLTSAVMLVARPGTPQRGDTVINLDQRNGLHVLKEWAAQAGKVPSTCVVTRSAAGGLSLRVEAYGPTEPDVGLTLESVIGWLEAQQRADESTGAAPIYTFGKVQLHPGTTDLDTCLEKIQRATRCPLRRMDESRTEWNIAVGDDALMVATAADSVRSEALPDYVAAYLHAAFQNEWARALFKDCQLPATDPPDTGSGTGLDRSLHAQLIAFAQRQNAPLSWSVNARAHVELAATHLGTGAIASYLREHASVLEQAAMREHEERAERASARLNQAVTFVGLLGAHQVFLTFLPSDSSDFLRMEVSAGAFLLLVGVFWFLSRRR
jgi:hypothetical protein